MKKTSLLLLLVTTAALAVCATAGAQSAANDETVRVLLEAALRQYLDPGSELSVSVTGVQQDSAGGLTIGGVTIDASPAIVKGVRAELFAQLTNVALDAGLAAGTGGVNASVRFKSIGSGMLVGRTTAEELQKALAARFPLLVDPVVTFSAGQFRVTGNLRDGGQSASLRGRFVIDRGQRVNVSVQEILVAGSPLPVELVQKELAKINPVLDLTGAPIPLRIRLIALHDNRIEVLAGTD